MTIRLNILRERAMKVIYYLEAVNDIEIVQESAILKVEEAKRQSWIGAIKEPSQELLNYADKARGEWDPVD